MTNAEVAACFEELADLLELEGANPFRVRAYRNAARTVAGLAESVETLVDEGADLTELPGIGKDLAEKIACIVHTGTLPQLEELRAKYPTGVLDMLKIPGLGPKKVAVLFRELGIQTLEELRAAAEAGRIAGLRGFGKKTEQSILEGIEHLQTAIARVYLAEAMPVAEAIREDIASLDCVDKAEIAGSFRRRKETVGDLDLLVTSTDSERVMDRLAENEFVEKVLQRGETKQRVRLRMGLEMDLRVVAPESYGAALAYFTGSKEHNIVVRRRGQERGLKINEYGVFRGEKRVGGETEEEVYAAIDLPWIPPELREARREFEWAEQGRLPKLIELRDIRGDLHMHTTATDGTATIEEMIRGAKARGLRYIAITDHSKRVTMANGLDATRLRKHWKDIDRVRGRISGIDVLCGVECDILEDATLDLPDDVLAEAEFVVAVLHYGLKLPREQITRRLLTAIENPYVDAIGHLTGRLIGRRPGADVDYDTIMKAAADNGVMLEINAHPSRLDLDDLHAMQAAYDYGIPILINTDAHSVGGLDVMQFGVFQARRGGLEKRHVANTKPLKSLVRMFRRNH